MRTNALKLWKNIWDLPTHKGAFLTILLLAMAASTFLALLTNYRENDQVRESVPDKVVVSRLNELQIQLKKLEATVNKPLPEVNLDVITQQITQLASRLDELREADSKKIAETLTHTQNTLGQELHSIKEVVTHLDDKKEPIKYLPIKSLPFSVVSIDSIQQEPVASVAYDYKTIPLEKGDALAGWKVIKIDYSKQIIELENLRAERVLVTHEHVG